MNGLVWFSTADLCVEVGRCVGRVGGGSWMFAQHLGNDGCGMPF